MPQITVPYRWTGWITPITLQRTIEVPEGFEEADGKVNQMQTQLDGAATKLNETSGSLDQTVVDCLLSTVDKLEIAMLNTYKLAVFIRGNFDARDTDEPQQAAILDSMVVSFTDAENRTKQGLKDLGDIHSQIMEQQNQVIMPAKREVEQMVKESDIKIASYESQIASQQSTTDALQRTMEREKAAVSELEEKVSSAEDAKTASDWGFGALTIAFTGLPGLIYTAVSGPIDPLNLQKALDSARDALKTAEEQYNTSTYKVWELQQVLAFMNARTQSERRLNATMPQMISMADALARKNITLQQQLGPIKDQSGKLVLAVGELQGDSDNTKKLAITKEEFAMAILEICEDALIDSGLVDEVQMVMAELFNEYGGAIPDAVEEKRTIVNNKLEFLKNVPSVQAKRR